MLAQPALEDICVSLILSLSVIVFTSPDIDSLVRRLRFEIWRERVGVEPTSAGLPPDNGFEVREAHQDPSAPII